ncbi:MAG TPA: 1,4-dihydroxy-2-naphthoate polyprenyltransferase [Acidimicrobiales bacterium]|nr:1,4-dihydroxy-2-naphthoate polyprenyltransferase [Acidimicrobiales bacterium]
MNDRSTGTAAAVPAPGPVKRWVLGARPRTLAAAAVPVAVGTACGWWFRSGGGGHLDASVVAGPGVVIWWRAVCALVVALAVQVGTNYANDYSDGVRGTDERRVGPVRLVASGLASPAAVRRAAVLSFLVAAAAGLALAAATTWWLVPIGAVCFAAGWLYTGGPKPYGYLGLGELFVFVFFGVVATVGSSYVQFGHLWVTAVDHLSVPFYAYVDRLLPLWAAIPVGLLATALLEANNLRDIAGDVVAGKKTLAVRLGRHRAGWLYVGSMIGVAAGIVLVGLVRPWAFLALLALPLALPPCRLALSGADGRALLPALGATGRLQLVVGGLLTLGILL